MDDGPYGGPNICSKYLIPFTLMSDRVEQSFPGGTLLQKIIDTEMHHHHCTTMEVVQLAVSG